MLPEQIDEIYKSELISMVKKNAKLLLITDGLSNLFIILSVIFLGSAARASAWLIGLYWPPAVIGSEGAYSRTPFSRSSRDQS